MLLQRFLIWILVVVDGRLHWVLVAPIWLKAEGHPDFIKEVSSFPEAGVLQPKTLK